MVEVVVELVEVVEVVVLVVLVVVEVDLFNKKYNSKTYNVRY